MFVKFLQAKTYNPAFARWRIDAEASYRGLLPALVDGRDFAVEQDRQRLSRANRSPDVDRRTRLAVGGVARRTWFAEKKSCGKGAAADRPPAP
jgi:hypothetical protein